MPFVLLLQLESVGSDNEITGRVCRAERNGGERGIDNGDIWEGGGLSEGSGGDDDKGQSREDRVEDGWR